MNESVNQLYQGDCFDVLATIDRRSIDLIYLDPPFFTEKKHSLKNRERTKEFSFNDKWGSSIAYSQFLYERIQRTKPLLKETGSIFVHCDNNANHMVRSILDSIFGTDNFRSEIIWSYKRWSNDTKGLLASHQNIYFYSVSSKFKFNTIYNSYSETTNIDQLLQTRARDEHNKSVYAFDRDGNFRPGKRKKGVPLSDVWELPYLNPKAKERVGYPTQKPILLLEQIVRLVTDKDDIVLDPFCGSGTTCVAAKLLGRQYIGIDISAEAIQLAQKRLARPIKTESRLVNNGREAYVNVDKEAIALLNGIPYYPVHRNKGIDAILVEQFEGTPVLVRVQKEGETLLEAASLLFNAKSKKQAKKAFLIQTHHSNSLLEDLQEFKGLILLQIPSLQIINALKSGQ